MPPIEPGEEDERITLCRNCGKPKHEHEASRWCVGKGSGQFFQGDYRIIGTWCKGPGIPHYFAPTEMDRCDYCDFKPCANEECTLQHGHVESCLSVPSPDSLRRLEEIEARLNSPSWWNMTMSDARNDIRYLLDQLKERR